MVRTGVAGLILGLGWMLTGQCEGASVRLAMPRGVMIETEAGGLLLFTGDPAAGAPEILESGGDTLVVRYVLEPAGVPAIACTSAITVKNTEGHTDAVVDMTLSFSEAFCEDMEVTVPFLWKPAGAVRAGTVVCPLYNGWAKRFGLESDGVRAEWRLGNWMTGADTAQLGLPVVEVEAGDVHASISTDATFSSLFELHGGEGGVLGTISYRYLGSKVPLQGEEKRTFGFSLGNGKGGVESSLEGFFREILPDVPAGPAWLHDIAMVYYNYLADGGEGWDNDVRELARLLTPEERRRVALCFHGWYDGLGSYAFDQTSGRMKEEWVAMPRTRAVRLTKAEVAEMLGRTRDLGFRVLWYFGDGLVQDSGGPNYHADWNLLDENGKAPRPCWTGPDTSGETFPRNPAHPEVAQWYRSYLAALLESYGAVVDGFVWDETFYIRSGDIALKPFPAYCARAMLDLVKTLTAQVEAFDPEKVLLASDDVGVFDSTDVIGYAMAADGTYQDSWCLPAAWSYALFPNWRNTSWSCNWSPVTRIDRTRWGVENFGTPVAISNGWGDDQGPSEWRAEIRDEILRLFRERLARQPVRYLSEDPARLLRSAPK